MTNTTNMAIMPFNEQHTMNCIGQYYKSEGVQNLNITTETRVEKSEDNPSGYDTIVDFRVEGEFIHEGKIQKYSKRLSVGELKLIIETMLQQQDYIVESINVNLKLEPGIVDAHGIPPLNLGGRFNGITVNCKKFDPEQDIDNGKTM